MDVEIVPLSKSMDRSGFTCGHDALDLFFTRYAGQNQWKYRLAMTYVALLEEGILGFVTVTSASVEAQDLPDSRLKARLPAYPLPVLRVARLGVSTQAQGRGVGAGLLRHALLLALEQRDRTGCVGVVTDAKPEALAFYERFGFAELEGVVRGRGAGMPTPMFLDIRTVARAMSS